MPISHSRRLVFVHIPKTGGSSIEQVLGIRGLGNAGTNDPVPEMAFGKLDGVHLQHLTLVELTGRGLLDGPAANYFRFAIVRNPWDRMVSEFEYQRRRGVLTEQGISNFEEFATAIADGHYDDHVHFRPQMDFLVNESGSISVDRIGRFERLARDFRKICEAAQVDAPGLPLLKRTSHRHFASYYNEHTQEIVAVRFAADIDRLGYRFNEKNLEQRVRRPVDVVRERVRHRRGS